MNESFILRLRAGRRAFGVSFSCGSVMTDGVGSIENLRDCYYLFVEEDMVMA